jgi:hypothetical protein
MSEASAPHYPALRAMVRRLSVSSTTQAFDLTGGLCVWPRVGTLQPRASSRADFFS